MGAVDGHSLREALDAWRADRSSVYLANCVDDAAARVSRSEVPRRVHRWWTDLAKHYDPVTATTVLATLEHQAENDDVSWRIVLLRETPLVPVLRANGITDGSPRGQWMNLVDRLGMLLAWPDDPRVAVALAQVIWRPPFYDPFPMKMSRRMRPGGLWGAIAHAMVERVCAIGDLRALEMLRAVERPLIEAAARAAPAPRTRHGNAIDAAWQAVIDEPDGIAPRLVLADAYMQREDPRGDFIAAQCRPLIAIEEARARGDELDPSGLFGANAEQMAKLLEASWHRWLGDVSLVANRRSTFRGGLLHHVELGHVATPPWAWDGVELHRELCAINRLSPAADCDRARYAAFVAQLPYTPAWVTVDRETLDALAGRDVALRGIYVPLVRRPVVGNLVRDAIALAPERVGLWFCNDELPIVRRIIYDRPAMEFHLQIVDGQTDPTIVAELTALPNVRSVRKT